MNRKDALALDRADKLKNKRKEFILPKDTIYLDGNSLGVLPKTAMQRVKRAVEKEWGQDLIRSWNKNGWFHLALKAGNKLAPLIGAAKDSVVVTDSISVNLFKVLSAAVAKNRGRTVILTDKHNFPNDLYVAQGLAAFESSGLSVKMVEPEAVMSAIDSSVAAVMLTDVDYRSARRHDMKAITARAHEVGALAIWDLAHSAGALPVELMECDADFAIGCTYKYLNGGPGSPAFVFVHPRLQNQVVPGLVGWWGHERPFDFAREYAPALGIARFQSGTQPILSLQGLDAALDVWKGVSMKQVYDKAKKLCQLFATRALERGGQHGVMLYGPLDFNERGSHVCLAHDNAYAVMQALIDRGVIGDFRAPNLMRFGFAPLYNSFAEAFDAAEVLGDILDKGLWNKPKYLTKKAVT